MGNRETLVNAVAFIIAIFTIAVIIVRCVTACFRILLIKLYEIIFHRKINPDK
jgi:hypothetical protein